MYRYMLQMINFLLFNKIVNYLMHSTFFLLFYFIIPMKNEINKSNLLCHINTYNVKVLVTACKYDNE